MRFSLYTEIQLHPGKTQEQLYAEVLEQIVNADRLGYDVAAIEHFFFPKFSISANPTALWAAAAQRTRDIRFRTMLHALPYHNPTVLASVIHTTHILTGGAHEWGVGRGHGWIPPKAGVPLDEHARPRYEEAVDLLLAALDNEEFSHHGEYFDVDHSHVVPFVSTPYRVYLGGTSDRTYTLAAERAGASPSRRSSRTRCSSSSSTSTAPPAREGPSPTSCGSTPATSTRIATRRFARVTSGSPASSRATAPRSPSTRSPTPTASSPPAMASTRRGSWSSWPRSHEQLIDEDYVWVGTPEDIVARIEETIGVCRAQGDRHHGQRRRGAALDGDQEPGAVRRAGRAALQGPGHGRGAGVDRRHAGVRDRCRRDRGGIFAGHLAQVADVSVLATPRSRRRAQRRQPSHQQAQQAREQRHRSERPGRSRAVRRSASWQRRRTGSRRPRPSLEGRFPDATIVTVLNGLGAEVVRAHGDWPIVSGVTFVSSTKHSDTSSTCSTPRPGSGRTRDAVHAGRDRRPDRALGPQSGGHPDLRPAQWSKLIFNATVSSVAALTGLRHDHHFADEEAPTDLGHLVHDLVDEATVRGGGGIELHDDPWEMNVLATRRGSAHYPSMLEDVDAHRKTEIDLLTGALVRGRRSTTCRCRSTRRCTDS